MRDMTHFHPIEHWTHLKHLNENHMTFVYATVLSSIFTAASAAAVVIFQIKY